MKRELTGRQEVVRLVDTFYDKVNRDPLLAPIFNEVAQVDWDHHLPVMYQFWESVLFGAGTFQGRPFPKHAVLPVDQPHFERWLTLFRDTMDELFEGPKAEEAKLRALCVADTFAMRMGVLRDAGGLRRAVYPSAEALGAIRHGGGD